MTRWYGSLAVRRTCAIAHNDCPYDQGAVNCRLDLSYTTVFVSYNLTDLLTFTVGCEVIRNLYPKCALLILFFVIVIVIDIDILFFIIIIIIIIIIIRAIIIISIFIIIININIVVVIIIINIINILTAYLDITDIAFGFIYLIQIYNL